MLYKYIFHEHAQKDYENSLQWYAQRSIKAAENFVIAVEDALELICKHPLRWRNVYKDYHELGLKKYPFTLIYTIEAKTQTAVIHSITITKETPGENTKVAQSFLFFQRNFPQNKIFR